MEGLYLIKKVEEFINKFLDTEYKTFILLYTEKNQEIFSEKFKTLRNYYRNDVANARWIWDRKESEIEELIEEGNQYIKGKIKRELFQIKEYDNDEYGKIYRCYISNNYYGKLEINKLKYWQNYFVAKIDNQWKIISSYIIKSEMDEKKKFPTDLNKSWDHSRGDEFDRLGKPTAVLKIQPPTHPLEIEEYNANN